MRISDWSSDVCSSDLRHPQRGANMSYIDGFVVPVPQENLVACRNLARKAGKIWKEHGALEYVECVADDVQPGKHTSLPQSVKPKPGEVVVFARSEEHTSELQSLMRSSYAVCYLKKKKN